MNPGISVGGCERAARWTGGVCASTPAGSLRAGGNALSILAAGTVTGAAAGSRRTAFVPEKSANQMAATRRPASRPDTAAFTGK